MTDKHTPSWKTVGCPHCNAMAGEPCNTPVKHPKAGEWPYKAVRPHKIRIFAAAIATGATE